MGTTDVDPVLLRAYATAAVHAGEQAIIHNAAEVVGSVAGLLDTLGPSDTYAYMLSPDFQTDGSIRLPVGTTRDDIRALYEVVRGRSDVIGEEPLIELRGSWYAFWESVSTGRLKGATEEHTHPLAVLSPTNSGEGITGEIIWPRLPWQMLGTGSDVMSETEPQDARQQLRLRHMRMIDAIAAQDVAALVSEFDAGGASAIRDYVNDTDMLVSLAGTDGHREYYEALFDRYEILRVDLVHRVTQPWYLFAETRLSVRERAGDDTTLAFHNATIHAPGKSGTFIACLGWGTDPA